MDVAAIEDQLSELWDRKTEASSELQQDTVTRACVLNLVICTASQERTREISQIVSGITNEHPGRVILIEYQPEAPHVGLEVDTTIYCHLSAGGRQQICCEQIRIRSAGEGIQQVASLVNPLLVSDLPVFLWWTDRFDLDSRLLAKMLKAADHLIFDSTNWSSPHGGMANLAVFFEQRPGVAVSDLNWARLTPWRRLISGFFDCPAYRPYLDQLEHLEIHCGSADGDNRPVSSQAWLLAGWLASRLKWKVHSKLHWVDADTCLWSWQSRKQKVTVQIKRGSEPDSDGLQSVHLGATGEPSAQFSVSLASDKIHLKSSATLSGSEPVEGMLRLDETGEEELVTKELLILGHDRIYAQGLRYLTRLSHTVS